MTTWTLLMALTACQHSFAIHCYTPATEQAGLSHTCQHLCCHSHSRPLAAELIKLCAGKHVTRILSSRPTSVVSLSL